MAFDPKFIRNFSIVAHIDHGKSTLADQLLLQSGAISTREFREQLLDDMDLERERGITIKARAVAINPVLNKIDMQASRPDEIREEIMSTLGIDPSEVLAISAKTGQGVPDVFRAIVERVPPPAGDPDAPLRALIFDSKFDDYQGVIIYVRVVDGVLRVGQKIRLMAGDTEHEVIGLGRFRPHGVPCDELGVGQVGYVTANIKRLSDVHIGDTITGSPRGARVALPG